MTSKLQADPSTLQRWAINEDDRYDVGVANDACVQLAHRDVVSRSFLEFLTKWVPKGQVTSERFERFAVAWDRAQGEKVVAHLGSQVPIPDDLVDEEGPEA